MSKNDDPNKPLPEGLQPRANLDGRVLYSRTFATEAAQLCAQGASWGDLAKHFQATRDDIRLWCVTHPEFGKACQVGREEASDRVTMALYERAVGFSYTESSITETPDGVRSNTTNKHVPPDVSAAQYWLENRRPELWRRKVEVEHSGEVHTTTRLPPVAADADEWSKLYAPPTTVQ